MARSRNRKQRRVSHETRPRLRRDSFSPSDLLHTVSPIKTNLDVFGSVPSFSLPFVPNVIRPTKIVRTTYRQSNTRPIRSSLKNVYGFGGYAKLSQNEVKKESSKTVCEKRSERKQMMFATGAAGSTGFKKPRFIENSRLICKKRRS